MQRQKQVNDAHQVLMAPIKERERKIAQQNKARLEGKPVFVPLE